MEFFPPVIFEIKAKATEAIASFGVVNKELALMEKNGIAASGGIAAVTAAARYARIAILGMTGAFAILGVAGIKQAMEQQSAMSKLQIAVENTGVAFKDFAPYVEQHSQAMINLGFADDQVIEALTKMTTATGSPKTALDALGAAADLARYKHISLAEAGTLIAKSSMGAARGLMDLGLKIGVTIPKGADLATILKMVEDRVGGTAKAFGTTFEGKLAIANARFDQLKEKIGNELIPYAIQLTDWISNTAIPKFREFTDFIKRNGTAIKNFAMAIAGFWVGTKIAASILAIIKVVNLLRDAYIATGIAAAFATGGVSVASASAALAAVGIVLASKNVWDLMHDKGGTTPTPTPAGYGYAGGAKSMGPIPDITGKGVPTIKPTPKPTPSSSPTVQNITVYASNTNDISKKLAKAAKNGQPIGGK